MFTGIIQDVGSICRIDSSGVDKQIKVRTNKLSCKEIALGDSIAVNGVCLTAIKIRKHSFLADVSAETIAHTTFSELKAESKVNLELALTPQSRLGGHMVSGHVDGVGKVVHIENEGASIRYNFKLDKSLSHYVSRKGSICINGVSLTVNSVDENQFSVNLVPHTLQETTLNQLRVGSRVNIEVDLIARYLERLLQGGMPARESHKPLDEDFLANTGFITT